MATILYPTIDGLKYQSVMSKGGFSVETAATPCEVTYSPHGFWTIQDGSPKEDAKPASGAVMEWCVDHQPFMQSFQQVTARYCGADAQFTFHIVNVSDVETGEDTLLVAVPNKPVHYTDFGKSVVVEGVEAGLVLMTIAAEMSLADCGTVLSESGAAKAETPPTYGQNFFAKYLVNAKCFEKGWDILD
jgi:hypothetical protein